MGLFPEWAQEVSPPSQLSAEKSQVEIAKIISIVCFSSQRASKSEWIELEAKSPAETNLWFSVSLSELWPRALIDDDFLIKLGGAELAGVQMRLCQHRGAKWRNGEEPPEGERWQKQESQSETQGGLMSVVESK